MICALRLPGLYDSDPGYDFVPFCYSYRCYLTFTEPCLIFIISPCSAAFENSFMLTFDSNRKIFEKLIFILKCKFSSWKDNNYNKN